MEGRTRVCVRLCTCALPGQLVEGAEVSEQPRGQPRAHKARGRGGGKEQDSFFAIQLTLEAPCAWAGKSKADQSSHYVPGLSQAAWHKGLSPAGWGPALKGESSGQHCYHQPPGLSREQHREWWACCGELQLQPLQSCYSCSHPERTLMLECGEIPAGCTAPVPPHPSAEGP